MWGNLYLKVELFNLPYFLFIALICVCFVVSTFLSRRFGKDWTYRFISVLAWSNFALHFVKQLNPFYVASWPMGLGRSTAENLCAFLIMVSPFIIKWGNKYMKDYLFYMGIISSLLVFLCPTSAFGLDLGELENFLEVSRFYICHIPLLIIGYLEVDSGFHELNYHRLIAMPFMFMTVEAILVANACLLNLVLYKLPWGEFLDRGNPLLNSSLPFGPTPEMDKILGAFYPMLIPYLQTYYVDGIIKFTPVLYLFVPYAIGTLLLGPLLALPFENRRMKLDIEWIKMKYKMRKIERNC